MHIKSIKSFTLWRATNKRKYCFLFKITVIINAVATILVIHISGKKTKNLKPYSEKANGLSILFTIKTNQQ